MLHGLLEGELHVQTLVDGIVLAAFLAVATQITRIVTTAESILDAVGIRRTDDPVAVLHRLMDILEDLRLFFAKDFDPLPHSDVINNHITRRLYCQISSKPLCEEVVARMKS